MPADRSLPLWAGRAAALIGILLVAINLRTAVASLSPILNLISKDVPLSPLVLGLIGAAPPLSFAIAGLVAPWLARRIALPGAILVATAAMVIGQLARALATSPELLIAATVVSLLGAGIGNVLLPPVVKRYFPDRITQVTTAYAVLISVSTALPALAAVPVATALGWRASLGVWVLLAVTAVFPWIVASASHVRSRRRARENPDDTIVETETALEGRLFRSPVAWSVTIIFAVSAINVYAIFAWLPRLLVEYAHVSQGSAGALLSLYAIIGFPAALLVPYLASRMRNIGVLIYFSVAVIAIGYLGLILAPTVAPALWICIAGLGATLFPLSLVLINLRTRTHRGAVALSGFVQGIGYVIAAASPLTFGQLAVATGTWSWSLGFLLVVSLAAIPAGIILNRGRFLEDDLAARGKAIH